MNGMLIMMGKLVPFFIPLQMRSSLTMTNRILCPWKGRNILKLKINIGSLFHFKMKISMQ